MTDEWDDLERLAKQVEEIRQQINAIEAANTKLVEPPLAEFIIGDQYLNQQKIYPRQLTLLRTIFCDLEGLTPYDHQVLDEWGTGFVLDSADRQAPSYEPAPERACTIGTTPDLRERMRRNRAENRRWFREPNLVIGRRGGKGHVAAISCARVVWALLALGNPQEYFGMAPDKKLTILVFAGNHEQARYNLFADIASTIVAGPGFAPYLVRLTRDRLVLRTPADMARPDGIHDGTIEIIAKETTGNAGRGVAAIAMFFDEMAFIEPATSRASAEHIYAASTPALDQFGEWAMVMETSSPWQMLGEFYAIHGRALEVDPLTMEAAYPEMFTLQLASWDPYVDADRATTIPLANPTEAATIPALTTSGGTPRCFPDPGRPISVYDDQMRRLERQAPYDFRRERRAQWGTVNHPFLNPVKINEIWLPYNGQALNIQERGVSFRNYLLVADPASTHDAFAWAIGHLDPADQNGRPHVVIDLIRRRLPADYGGHLDLTHILNQLEADARAFDVSEIVTDQYGGDFVVTDLNRRLADTRRGPTGVARLLHRTRDRNMATATRFREAITLNQLHCYPCPELQQELEFLQETGGKVAAPTRGPVQTDDVAMAVMVLTELLLEKVAYQTLHTALSATRLSGRFPGGSHPYAERFSKAGRWSRRNLSNNPARGGHRRLPYRY